MHRLLQVAANIYDATTNNSTLLGKDYPTVFRPLFTRDISGDVFITGYTNVSTVSGAEDTVFSIPFDASQLGQPTLDSIPVNVYGVPWIIGVKKGFPNFNKFSLESVVTVTRKLQLSRTNDPSLSGIGGIPMMLTATNQMYVFSITNYLGVQFWNSYSNACTNVTIIVHDRFSTTLTNPALNLTSDYDVSAVADVAVWAGGWTNGNLVANSFLLPLGAHGTNLVFLPTSVYQFGTGSFVDASLASNFETYPPTTLPPFGLLVTNRLQIIMLDNGHVIDYAQFSGPDSSRNLNTELADPISTGLPAYQWSTNLFQGFVPCGVINQINVSAGLATLVTPNDGGSWASPPGLPAELRGKNGGIEAYFRGFLAPNGLYAFGAKIYTNTEYVVQAPFTPTRWIVEYTSWQANDPLVHYLSSDLNFSGYEPSWPLATGLTKWSRSPDILPSLGYLNARYQPWGKVYSQAVSDNNPYNLAYKDPLVRKSDDWNFPSGNGLPLTTLGQIHRGTPWQTIFLKATNILALANVSQNGFTVWTNWTGNGNLADAVQTAPVQDWRLASHLTALFNTNQLTSLFSVNTPDPIAWQGLLNGLTVFTNIPEELNSVLISSNSPQAAIVANGVQAVRASRPGQIFNDVGDILAVPQLADISPFLAGLNVTNRISDEAYEIIPSQLLSLLRADSIGSVVVMNNQPLVQFTGYDGYDYAVQASSDLINWASISTNYPVNGEFIFTNSVMLNAEQEFYRSVLLQ